MKKILLVALVLMVLWFLISAGIVLAAGGIDGWQAYVKALETGVQAYIEFTKSSFQGFAQVLGFVLDMFKEAIK